MEQDDLLELDLSKQGGNEPHRFKIAPITEEMLGKNRKPNLQVDGAGEAVQRDGLCPDSFMSVHPHHATHNACHADIVHVLLRWSIIHFRKPITSFGHWPACALNLLQTISPCSPNRTHWSPVSSRHGHDTLGSDHTALLSHKPN